MSGNLSPFLATNPPEHQFDGGVGLVVAKAVEGVENLASERCSDEWPRLWNGHVTVKGDVRPDPSEAPNHYSGCLTAPHPDPGNSQEQGNQEVS
jgi:hypothetical protein